MNVAGAWRWRAAVVGTALALGLSGCALTQGSGADGAEDPVEIAFLTVSSANTWLTASKEAMQVMADADGVKITEFDAKLETGRATQQIQDVIAANRYEGIIIATNDGVAVAPALEEAIAAGIKVVVLNQIVGERLDTADPQVNGVSASVLAPPTGTGERLGELARMACEGDEDCSIVYMYGIKGTPYDEAVRASFDSVIEQDSNIEVVASAEGGFLGTDEPRKATQDVLQSTPDFDVLVGAGDQQIRGAKLALDDAGLSQVKTIGVGASAPALEAIAAGTWFGDVAGAPADEGRAAYDAMMAAINDGTVTGGVDVVSDLPDGGLVTGENVDQFTAQWAG